MIFSDTNTNKGIVQDIRWRVGADSDSFRLEDITRLANSAMDEYQSIAFNDDTNRVDFPISTTNIVSGQSDYQAPTDLIDFISLKILDANDNTIVLEKIYDPEDGQDLEEKYGTGTPRYFMHRHNSFFLYPVPNYNKTSGLIAEYVRNTEYFLTTDTTKEPGIPPIHHPFINLWVSYEYAKKHSLDNLNSILNDLEKMRQSIKTYWATKGKYQAVRLVAGNQSNK